MGSSREVLSETRERMVVDNKIFVAVSKELKESKSTLLWALQNSNGKKICIIYVHVPAKMIPMPMGGKFPVSRVGENELKAFREQENGKMQAILDGYLQICADVGAHAEKMHIEMNSIEAGIVEMITQQRIRSLVMGAAADSRFSRRMMEPKSKKANYVRKHAPDFCCIRFVCKGRLICTSKGVREPNSDVGGRLSNCSDNDQHNAGILSRESSSSIGHSDLDGYEECFDKSGHSSRSSYSQSLVCSRETESAFSSPCSSLGKEDVRESGLDLLALPGLPPTKFQGSSPPSVLESNRNDDPYDQVLQALTQAEISRRDAFDESMRRRKAEKVAMDAICKAAATENLYSEEFKQRKEKEEELAMCKEELEISKSQWEKVSQELHEALDQKLSLETELEKSKLNEKDMENKLLSAVELLQKLKTEREELQVERDHSLQEAEELRKRFPEGSSNAHVPFYFSVFSFSDLQNATNNFDPSLIIGKGGYGKIYKGFLRHTEVAIKILDPESKQGPQEFEQEVDVLSKLRHPNLVTLMGACPESWALIYEYLPGGSLEDRLACKDNTPPLPWQTRIRIATELCSALIFLHSSRPSCVVHGDLKPSNILLDDNLVSKLGDFGICYVIPNNETSMEQAAKFCTHEPRGTFTYMDPELLRTGELTPKSDIFSFGIILLRLLTGKQSKGIGKEVEYALEKGTLDCILDSSAGDWPFVQAEQLARMALRCCDIYGRNRPNLVSDVWRVLEPMKVSCQSFQRASDDYIPHYLLCPIFQEIMKDPQIASDGFTYEAEAIKGWFDSGHETSPMTNLELANHDLIPNHALRSAIQEWLQHHRRSA
ncbi:U-box domain-containing protein 33-like isoform X2 [Amaranthus tricolor]|uniref:U-box domain-containing protein 33-like isoform X2 n=1 Tax=Amaranthus tricolor TaxID=29722 RepID=UPI0025858F74|nr:U-box domain-containing protein 33-like isoform X2 [Amaranthus tricolor]XP_057533563.1 U-box domain-containing protein 33-like isoform X2 [Amaranthus tricolor]